MIALDRQEPKSMPTHEEEWLELKKLPLVGKGMTLDSILSGMKHALLEESDPVVYQRALVDATYLDESLRWGQEQDSANAINAVIALPILEAFIGAAKTRKITFDSSVTPSNPN